ncbi:MAG TPA: hypothetical protein VGL18_16665, partial [Actinomycetota bacterium]
PMWAAQISPRTLLRKSNSARSSDRASYMDVDERNRPGETADGVGHAVLCVLDAAHEPVFGPGIRGKAPIELAFLYAISPVYGAAGLTGVWMSWFVRHRRSSSSRTRLSVVQR